MTPEQQLAQGIASGNSTLVEQACQLGHSFGDYKRGGFRTWLGTAAQRGSAVVIEVMLDAGFNIDALRLPEKSTALETAIGFDHDEVVELLLRRGANPNLGRPLIGALNEQKTPERRLKYVKLLVEHGADANRLYDLYGDPNKQFAALDWTNDPAVVEYLRAHGARKAAELKADQGEKVATAPALTPRDEIIEYFDKNFGRVDRRCLVEIVATGHPVAIHVIRPEGNRTHATLFTKGLSDKPMVQPAGQQEYAYAELFIQIPGACLTGAGINPEFAWVVHWMRKIAQYPHGHRTWLGGPLTIVANGEPPRSLGPNTKFTSWLLLAEKSFQRSDGSKIQLYRMTPIHTDEREMEIEKGAPALMRAFDRAGLPFIVDFERKSIIGT